jgi:hypothetical protein
MTKQNNEDLLDLSKLTPSDLVELEALLVQDYQDKRSSEDFDASDEASAEELTAIVDTLNEVRAEMTSQENLAASDEIVSGVKGADYLAKVNAKADKEAAAAAEKEAAAEAEVAAEAAAAAELEATEAAAAAAAVDIDVDASADVTGTKDFDLAEKKTVAISTKGLKGDDKIVIPEAAEQRDLGITAGADIRGFNAGQGFTDWSEVSRAFVAKRPDLRSKGAEGDGNQTLVASVHGDYPADRVLGNDIDDTMNKINAVASQEAVVASGGLCAPLTPYYQLTTYGDACRPVRDNFPQFKADRGGIRFLPAPKLTDLAGSTRITTAAQDAAGYTNQTPAGTTAPKPCLHVTCEAEETCIIQATSRCLTFGNMGSRTYPEQVEAWIKLGMAEFARVAEEALLDSVQAASTKVTASQIYGATYSLMEQISLLVANFRSRHRLCSNMTMKALLPWWVKEVFRVDIAGQAPGDGMARYSVSDAQITDWFSMRGVNITFFQDKATTETAPFAIPANAGVLPTWPTSFEWYLFPEGSFVYLDGGTLDLGLVRDSTLNSQNDYTIFYEEFNGLCFIGLESYAVTSTLIPNGTYAPADTLRA